MSGVRRLPVTSWLGLIILSLSSCAAPPPMTESSPRPSPSPSTETVQPSVPVPQSPMAPSKTVMVKVYQVDHQCMNLVPESVAVPADKPMEGAIATIIAAQSSPDFELAGYRVAVKDGVATVDLRLAPSSKRSFVSLSSCEQLALFGGIRKTLTGNPQWKIQSIRFTERGQEIVL